MWSPSKYSPFDTIHFPTSVSIVGSNLGFPLLLSPSAAMSFHFQTSSHHPNSAPAAPICIWGIVYPRFVTCDDPFQEFIDFLGSFSVGATLLPSQLLLRSEQFRYNLGANLFHMQMLRQNRVNGRLSQAKFFCYHSNSQSAVTEHKRTHTIIVFITT